MDRKAAYQAGVVPLYFGGVMTEPEKQDYRKYTLCTADIFQEKDCAGFKSLAGSGMCLHQGLGFACEAEEGSNEQSRNI
jgi:hypothetical protein